jgi:hypothetical protein
MLLLPFISSSFPSFSKIYPGNPVNPVEKILCNPPAVLEENLKMILEEIGVVIETFSRTRIVLGDSPTKWYGLKIEVTGS